jgi:hypothetical protein
MTFVPMTYHEARKNIAYRAWTPEKAWEYVQTQNWHRDQNDRYYRWSLFYHRVARERVFFEDAKRYLIGTAEHERRLALHYNRLARRYPHFRKIPISVFRQRSLLLQSSLRAENQKFCEFYTINLNALQSQFVADGLTWDVKPLLFRFDYLNPKRR